MEMALLEPCDFEPERVRNPKHEEMEDNENDERDKVHLGVSVNFVKSCQPQENGFVVANTQRE